MLLTGDELELLLYFKTEYRKGTISIRVKMRRYEERIRESSGQINTLYDALHNYHHYHKRKMNGEWKSNESTMSADVKTDVVASRRCVQ